ncbi:IMPACT family protein [Marinilabilia rubra]|uniref:YigZ family protein n=1 Tax=Marinilabilia rubra TaxID=2162893 RepID=A0A2U2BAR6_9BACT|nr:YigZ family protein [Marinilabilia rubra]PWE00164.1 YigZ family protein [Marinilabilia rubra]
MQTDSYKTIKYPVEGLFKEKGSKFLAFAWPVQNEDEINEHVEAIKKKYHDARHHCFAWELGIDGMNFRMNDDGEPSGTAGKPILGQIHSHEVTNVLVVVVRYFGGVKLGTGGLIQAYKAATADALSKAEILECTIDKSFSIRFAYDMMNPVMRVVDEEGLGVKDQLFEADCRLTLSVRESKFDALVGRFQQTYGIEVLKEDK